VPDLMETLIGREREAWDASGGGDGRWYRENLTEDARLVFAGVPESMGRETTAAAVDESTGGWEHYELQQVHLVELGSDAALLTYLAVARRGGEENDFVASISTAYVKHGDRWLLAFHQQTPQA
jgi:hypothetical protein